MSTLALLNWAQRQSPRALVQFARSGAVDRMSAPECYAMILALSTKLEAALDALDLNSQEASITIMPNEPDHPPVTEAEQTADLVEIHRKLDAFVAKPGMPHLGETRQSSSESIELAERAADWEQVP